MARSKTMSKRTSLRLTPQLERKLSDIQKLEGGDLAFHIRCALNAYLDGRFKFHHVLESRADQLLSASGEEQPEDNAQNTA